MCRRHQWVAATLSRSTVGVVGRVGQPRPVLTAANPKQKETERDDHSNPPWQLTSPHHNSQLSRNWHTTNRAVGLNSLPAQPSGYPPVGRSNRSSDLTDYLNLRVRSRAASSGVAPRREDIVILNGSTHNQGLSVQDRPAARWLSLLPSDGGPSASRLMAGQRQSRSKARSAASWRQHNRPPGECSQCISRLMGVHLSAHCAAQTLLHALQLARLSRPPLTQASVRVANGCKPAELGDHPPPDDGVLGGLGDDFSPRCRHGQNREVPR